MSYQFTEFRRGDFAAYLRFVSRLRPEKEATAADLRHRWRTFDNPWDGYLLLAHTADELAATLTLSARRLRTPGGDVLPCFELGDGWTSDRHRKKGLFHALGGRARDLVFSGTDTRLIVGAPNPSAEPNWRKHGYLFTRDDGTRLALLPDVPELLRRRLRDEPRAQPAARTQRPGRGGGAGEALVELPFDEYERRTRELPRMNDREAPGGGYLRWRLRDSPDGYRYFAARGEGRELLCALRVTRLGDLPVLVASECYLDLCPAAASSEGSVAQLRLLRRIGARCYRRHGGVYVNARLDLSWSRHLRALRHRYLVHRPQPLIFLFRDGPPRGHEALLCEMRKVFQLSDCDVG